MKKLSLVLTLALIIGMLAGCAGTPVVYYSDCTCPEGSHTATPGTEATLPVTTEGAVKTGLAVITTMAGTDASAEADGKVEYTVNLAAVNVDENGVITACKIDSIGVTVSFGADGVITSDLTADILTKNELGYDYGMVAYQASTMEWFEQAQALADYAVGKTVEQLRSGAVNESGYAADVDLATSATIHLSGYVDAIEAAVANAQYLGAQAGDELRLASLSSLSDCASADGETAGNAQLNVDAVALTLNGGVITSCYIDSVQAKAAFGADGVITSDLSGTVLTKNQLGSDYGMVNWGQATYEWNEQAANFCAYVTGKTPDEVAGIAISETTKPAEGTDLAASVTISIIGFQNLIAKAAQ